MSGPVDGVATHLEALVWALLQTKGPILELGAGYYSTPIVHAAAEVQSRLVVTVETNRRFLEEARKYESQNHHVRGPGADGIHPDNGERGDWAVVLVDHGFAARRAESVRRYQEAAEFLVVHDTEPEVAGLYPGLADALAEFAERRDFTRLVPHTTVVWR